MGKNTVKQQGVGAIYNACINVKPEGGDPRHMWGIQLFRRIFGPQNLVKSDQISTT